jgi:hypothetical protein
MQSHNSLEHAPMGVSSSIIHERMTQMKVAKKNLSTLSRLVFSSMNTDSKDFSPYLEDMKTYNGFESMQAKLSSWMRTCLWNACLDMLVVDKEDVFCVLWLEVSKDKRDKTL